LMRGYRFMETGRFRRFEVKIASETLPDCVPLLYHLTTVYSELFKHV